MSAMSLAGCATTLRAIQAAGNPQMHLQQSHARIGVLVFEGVRRDYPYVDSEVLRRSFPYDTIEDDTAYRPLSARDAVTESYRQVFWVTRSESADPPVTGIRSYPIAQFQAQYYFPADYHNAIRQRILTQIAQHGGIPVDLQARGYARQAMGKTARELATLIFAQEPIDYLLLFHYTTLKTEGRRQPGALIALQERLQGKDPWRMAYGIFLPYAYRLYRRDVPKAMGMWISPPSEYGMFAERDRLDDAMAAALDMWEQHWASHALQY